MFKSVSANRDKMKQFYDSEQRMILFGHLAQKLLYINISERLFL